MTTQTVQKFTTPKFVELNWIISDYAKRPSLLQQLVDDGKAIAWLTRISKQEPQPYNKTSPCHHPCAFWLILLKNITIFVFLGIVVIGHLTWVSHQPESRTDWKIMFQIQPLKLVQTYQILSVPGSKYSASFLYSNLPQLRHQPCAAGMTYAQIRKR